MNSFVYHVDSVMLIPNASSPFQTASKVTHEKENKDIGPFGGLKCKEGIVSNSLISRESEGRMWTSFKTRMTGARKRGK